MRSQENGLSPLRLNKALSQAGVCSRRKADDLIVAGRVRVNRQTVTELGTKIQPETDQLEVDGRTVSLRRDPASHVYLAVHKPVQVVTTLSDPQGRTTVADLLPSELASRRVLPAGRLDYLSEGLLIMSTDGGFIHRLTHPRHHLPKTYRVRVQGRLEDGHLERMRSSMRLKDGTQLAPMQVEVLRRVSRQELWLEMTLSQGVNRQIRRICRDLDLSVVRIVRTRQGPVELGDLPPGKVRHLSKKEREAVYGDENEAI
jgi:23S rRNA pseudouridine2605 synthase